MKNVMDYGAAGDGVTLDTTAIQRAIDSGGTVYFPPGEYLTGTLYLKSNSTLHLESGAVILGSPDLNDYNADDFTPQNQVFTQERVTGKHLITAVGQSNISITGNGRIDGNRQAFYGDKTPCTAADYDGKLFDIPDGRRPGQMIYFCECSNVKIEGVQLYNATYWTCFLHGCEDVIISLLKILNDQRTPNGDGIDIDCCNRVSISNCIIDTGDDCITLRANCKCLTQERKCENIVITNCVLHTHCNCFRIGVGDGTVRNAVISNIVFHDSRTAIAINSNYSADPACGVQIENISFDNLVLHNVKRPFSILSQVRGDWTQTAAKTISNIYINNMQGTFTLHNSICGSGNTGVKHIVLRNIDLCCIGSTLPNVDGYRPFIEWSPQQSAGAFYVANAQDIAFENVRVRWQQNSGEWLYGISCYNSQDVSFYRCNFEKPANVDGVIHQTLPAAEE